MNEIGERLREVRESHGVSIEEAAEDLKIRPSQLKSLEDGDIKKFKDVLYVKYFIKNYAKYLGMDGDKLVDDFNEYLFDYTSRIPIDKIKEAQECKEEEKKIVSPYTKPVNKKTFFSIKLLYILVVLLLLIAGFLIVNGINNNNSQSGYLSYYFINK